MLTAVDTRGGETESCWFVDTEVGWRSSAVARAAMLSASTVFALFVSSCVHTLLCILTCESILVCTESSKEVIIAVVRVDCAQ